MNSVPLRRTSPWLTVGLAALAWIVLYRSILPFWDWVVYELLGLEAQTRLGEAIHFFLYDTSKIVLLLVAIIFAVAVLRSFFSVERTRVLLGGKRIGLGNLLAAGLGVVTPFCSCSAVPAFIGFVSAGVPLGITLTFLIASPMVNEVALVLLYTLFGWKIAALYLVSGLTLAVVAGLVLGRMGLERYVEPFVYQSDDSPL
ncbi:permease [Meiothermus hypogaeus]|uniref:Permease n=2 Tax=Meiothermus hypogaeus TaxID=884155 RepID=A0A511R729_9DEIN|nr:permease [Meiothermus hypogaeus]RIH74780.1 putative permease [Meiothermus hypogaeus]GEM84732.1 hypothetical protein MHY01S_28980 [Meiothermus hypogaeus NBRC 106114]